MCIYCIKKLFILGDGMKRVIGFGCFFVAVGMILSLFIESCVCFFVIVAGLLIVGFNLFCC